MIRMALKFFWSMARHQWAKWRGYQVLTPVAPLLYRARRCDRCEFNDEGQCAKCKCLIIAKTMMALERCPIGKWSPVWVKRMRQAGRSGRLFS